MSEEYLIDDRIIIPDNLKNMSSIELDAEIVRLEKRVKEEKRKKIEECFEKGVIQMEDVSMLIKKLQNGEKVLCPECKKGYFNNKNEKTRKSSPSFSCDYCGNYIHITPNIIID